MSDLPNLESGGVTEKEKQNTLLNSVHSKYIAMKVLAFTNCTIDVVRR